MEQIGKQLQVNLNKKGLAKVAESSYVCYIFENLKNKILGDKVNARAVSFRNGVLKIKTKDSASSTEVRFRIREIKKEINRKIEKDIVLRIEIKVII